jgi:hypothetical protein
LFYGGAAMEFLWGDENMAHLQKQHGIAVGSVQGALEIVATFRAFAGVVSGHHHKAI